MELLSPKTEIFILDRNNQYLENISTENRPVVLSLDKQLMLENFIFDASEDVFDVSRQQMIQGSKYQDEIRARIGTAEVFRQLTSYSCQEIGERLGMSETTTTEYLRRSRQMLKTDIFYSAFVLASVIKTLGQLYPMIQVPRNTHEIIRLAVMPNSLLPVIATPA